MPSTTPLWPHTAVLMIGGRSRRMGMAKHDLKGPDDSTMLEKALDCLRLTATNLVISGPREIRPDLDHVEDIRPGSGPLGAIESVLKSGLDDRYLFVPCDMPRLTPALLYRLGQTLEKADAAVFEQGGHEIRPVLPAGLRCSTAPRIEEVIECGTHSIHRFLDLLDVAVVPVNDRESSCLLNINTPEEWSEFLQGV